MKQFSKIQFVGWFIGKMKDWTVAASINPKYKYEIEKETEKAIQLHIFIENAISNGWYEWFPKSAIINIDEVLSK